MTTYKIVFLGDIVGKPGREVVKEYLPSIADTYQPLFIFVNGENSAAGLGITPPIAEDLFSRGVDAITLGNHAFSKREIEDYLSLDKPIIRPSNMPIGTAGRGHILIEKDGIEICVVNLCGRVFMELYEHPFTEIDRILEEINTPHIFLDFHAEATSEKYAMGYYLDGKVSAVVGTHTHVQTADEQILPGGTAYITDVGMCGPSMSVIGVKKEISIRKLRSTMASRFEVSETPGFLSGVCIEIDRETGHAVSIERIQWRD